MDMPASARLSLGRVGCLERWRENAGEVHTTALSCLGRSPKGCRVVPREVRVQTCVLCGLSSVGHIPE